MKPTLVFILTISLMLFGCSKDDQKASSFDNVPIAYTDDGVGEPALLFVHGWCADKSYWSNQVEYFKKNYRVVTVDLAGHGHSGSARKNWNPENFARDVIAVVNELELENVVLVGHSISEETIIRAARMEPKKINGIIGVDNFKEVDLDFNDSIKQEATMFFGLMERSFKVTTEFYANTYLFSPYTKGKVRKKVLKDVHQFDPEVAIPILKLLYTDYQMEKQFLKQMITPLYLINSDYQRTDTAALNEYCNHGYHLEMMYKVGHYPMLEDPETFNMLLDNVIEKIKETDFQRN